MYAAPPPSPRARGPPPVDPGTGAFGSTCARRRDLPPERKPRDPVSPFPILVAYARFACTAQRAFFCRTGSRGLHTRVTCSLHASPRALRVRVRPRCSTLARGFKTVSQRTRFFVSVRKTTRTLGDFLKRVRITYEHYKYKANTIHRVLSISIDTHPKHLTPGPPTSA